MALLSLQIRCGGRPMDERQRSDVTDGYTWRCPQCKTSTSIREGSFFAKSRIKLQMWMMIIWFWARDYPVTDAANDAHVSRVTAINIYQWLREVCSTKLLNTNIVLGGPGVVVQIDESLFRHKPKVRNI